MLLMDDGSLYGCGANTFGQLGNSRDGDSEVPTIVDLPAEQLVADVQCGEAHTLCLTAEGRVYQWGSKVACRSKADLFQPRLVAELATPGRAVVAVRCGGSHCMALTADGELYTWGDYHRGQLGHDQGPDNAPTAVTELTGLVAAFDAGETFSTCLTRSGALYMWGQNIHCLINAASPNERFPPSIILLPFSLSQIVCGSWHVVATPGIPIPIALELSKVTFETRYEQHPVDDLPELPKSAPPTVGRAPDHQDQGTADLAHLTLSTDEAAARSSRLKPPASAAPSRTLHPHGARIIVPAPPRAATASPAAPTKQ